MEERQCLVFNRMGRASLAEKEIVEQRPEEGEGAGGRRWGRVFKSARTASAKVLWRECVWHKRSKEAPVSREERTRRWTEKKHSIRSHTSCGPCEDRST